MLGMLALLIYAIPARVKEWAYAGFAFNLVSAFIACASIHDRHAGVCTLNDHAVTLEVS